MLKLVKSQTVCFTGHRSQKLPWRFNEEDVRCKAMKETLRHEIIGAVENGYKTFLCVMAMHRNGAVSQRRILRHKTDWSIAVQNTGLQVGGERQETLQRTIDEVGRSPLYL